MEEWKRNTDDATAPEVPDKHSREMEAVGTLAAGISHDFNNTLAPIIGYAELTMNLVGKDSQIYNYQEQILKAVIRVKDLVQHFLTLNRNEVEAINPVAGKLILKETLELIRASLPTNIDEVKGRSSMGRRTDNEAGRHGRS